MASDCIKPISAKYPIKTSFKSRSEVDEYLNQPNIQCLLCGRNLPEVLGGHLQAHKVTAEEYRTMYQIPRSRPLVTKDYHRRRGDMISAEDRRRFIENRVLATPGNYEERVGWLKEENKERAKDGVLRKSKKVGKNHPMVKLTEKQVKQIKRSKKGIYILGNIYGVSAAAIYAIKKGHSWKDI